jgi:predicted small secreted protein
MNRSIVLIFAFALLAVSLACRSQETTGAGDSPTNAYKALYTAVKSKDTEAIKRQLTKKTIEFGVFASQKNNTPLEKVYENGFTATTFSETLPNIRDERVNGDMGAVEVWNSKDSRWEDLPFIKEDGAWKLAMGELFAGTFKSPGLGRDILEKQAANAMANTAMPQNGGANNQPVPITNMAPGSQNSKAAK